MIAKLHDRDGRIAIPGFYRNVRAWSESEREYMSEVGPSDVRVLQNARAAKVWGEPGFSGYERTTIRPALTINGISGGYQGPGGKGVIPARALAKLSFRLVPDQDPQEVEARIRQFIKEITPSTVQSRMRVQSRARPVVLDRSHPAMRAAAFAYSKGFANMPVFLRCGGTIPVADSFRQLLGIPTVLMGFALPDDRMHAPNEKFHLPNFYNAIATSIWFLHALAAAGKPHLEARRKPARRLELLAAN
jgi:acetylornithine deacetylase/succinyl-diaminopimelate desuccinylase-like protein